MASIFWSKFLFLAVALTIAASAFADNTLTENESPPQAPEATLPAEDSNFQDYEHDSLLRTILGFPVYSFYIGAPDVNGVAYVPNFSPRVGLQYSFKDLGVSFSVPLPLPPEEIARRGPSDELNFLVSKYWRSQGIDLFFQNYRGFYIASPWSEVSAHKPEKYPQLPDAEIIHYGFNYYQVLDESSYSLKAAYSQMELQLTSGGSFLLTAFFDHLDLKRGEKFISGSETSDSNRFPEIKGVRLNTGGAGIGYGYTHVAENLQVSCQAIIGGGLQSQKIEEQGSSPTENIHFALKGNFNASLVYKFNSYAIGGKVLLDTLLSNVKNTQIYSSLLNGSIFFDSRF